MNDRAAPYEAPELHDGPPLAGEVLLAKAPARRLR